MLEVTRRHIIRTGILDFLSCCAALPALAQQAVKANAGKSPRLNWDAFVERLELAARQRRGPGWNQVRYTQQVADLAGSLDLREKLSITRAGRRNLHRSGPEFQDLLGSADVQISLITFESGQKIRCHDHPDMTGVMVCATGSVEVNEYDILEAPVRSGCLVKSAGRLHLEPGKGSTLTSRFKNVHSVSAGAFSQIVDIFTPPYNEERKKNTRWFELEPAPLSGSTDVFVAHPLSGH